MAHITGYVHAAAAAASGGASESSGTPAPPLFLCEGRATTALDASRRVAALAAALTQRLGMQVGDRVCLAALATDHCLEALLAVTAAGGIAAPLNWRWGAAEAAGAAVLVGARLVAADAACLPFALALAAAAPAGTLTGLLLLGPPTSFQEADLAAAQPLGLTPAFAEGLLGATLGASLALRSAPGNAALIVYTSGTTGKPKGVALTHSALHSQSMAKLLMCGYSSADVYLHAAPLFHIGGISSALAMLAAGARHVFLPRFDGPALLAAIQQHSVTSFIAVPTMVADLLAAASSAGTSALPSITRILVGGGGMSPALQHALAALCPAATVHAAYGMTEGASSLTFRTMWGPSNSSSGGSSSSSGTTAGPPGGVCVGRPPPGIELAIYTPLAGNVVGITGSGGSGGSSGGCIKLAGEGEVVTRGAHTMLGYWDDEDATSAAQLPGGWLRTGDLGCLRQGQLWLMGRAKDMIKSGGENVHAWEVERALGSHPAVALAAVVGAADWRLGEAVAAAIVLRPGWHWAGDRCQVLLARQHGGQYNGGGSTLGGSQTQTQNAQLALVAAADAVIPTVMRAAGLGGSSSIAGRAAVEEVVEEEQQEERREAGRAITYAEDLRSTLLQRSPSRGTGGSYGLHGAEDGLMAALDARPPSERERQPSSALQQLAAVAAGLQYATAAAAAATQCGGSSGNSGDSSGSRQAEDESQAVDGRALQQHCRAAGLAGFKLPRVFLMCDAAAASAAPPGSGRLVLPLNSTGKVVKHLLRETVQQHMGVAAGAPRSRL